MYYQTVAIGLLVCAIVESLGRGTETVNEYIKGMGAASDKIGDLRATNDKSV